MMKLAVVNLTGGGLSGGYIKYLRELLPELASHPRVDRLHVFLPPRFISLLDGVIPTENCLPCQDSWRGRINLRRQLLHLAPDVVFLPSYRWLELGIIPTVSMIRNMEPLVIPFGGNGSFEAARNLMRLFSARKACRKAHRVIAVSNFVRDFLINSWGVEPNKIGVAYHGVNTPASRETLSRPAALQNLGAGPFIFTAGSIRPARGLEDLIRALPRLAASGLRWPLVIAGAINASVLPYFKKLSALAREMDVAGNIVWAGELNSMEISWCYHHARVFVMTSRVEACPNIALEAMSHGCLTLAADNPPLPEFFQVCCTYYPPMDSAALAQGIVAAISSAPATTEQRRRQAKERAQEFTWKRTVEDTLRELELAVARSKPSQSSRP